MEKEGSLLGIARRPASRAPMELVPEVRITTASGVDKDYRGTREGRQVTVISESGWRAACADAGASLQWTTRRANLLIGGVDLKDCSGATIRIGDVTLEVTDELRPCGRMDEALQGLREALVPEWRGGVSCRVVSGGAIRVGDAVTLRRNLP